MEAQTAKDIGDIDAHRVLRQAQEPGDVVIARAGDHLRVDLPQSWRKALGPLRQFFLNPARPRSVDKSVDEDVHGAL